MSVRVYRLYSSARSIRIQGAFVSETYNTLPPRCIYGKQYLSAISIHLCKMKLDPSHFDDMLDTPLRAAGTSIESSYRRSSCYSDELPSPSGSWQKPNYKNAYTKIREFPNTLIYSKIHCIDASLKAKVGPLTRNSKSLLGRVDIQEDETLIQFMQAIDMQVGPTLLLLHLLRSLTDGSRPLSPVFKHHPLRKPSPSPY